MWLWRRLPVALCWLLVAPSAAARRVRLVGLVGAAMRACSCAVVISSSPCGVGDSTHRSGRFAGNVTPCRQGSASFSLAQELHACHLHCLCIDTLRLHLPSCILQHNNSLYPPACSARVCCLIYLGAPSTATMLGTSRMSAVSLVPRSITRTASTECAPAESAINFRSAV